MKTNPKSTTDDQQAKCQVLSERQSIGIRQFLGDDPAAVVVLGPASWPNGGKMVLHVIPCDITGADNAVRVAQGTAKISKPRKSGPGRPAITPNDSAPNNYPASP